MASMKVSVPTTTTRFSRTSRLPLQLSCVESMLPLHSAIASATLISSLSSESDSWALVPQGGFGFPFQSFSPHLCARHLFVYFTGRKCSVKWSIDYN
ncbi:hypothetical protein OIU79_002737 [Salix purpurea]|uniref:Uncharacterized protein n=1 Tax=Salix purpurea TaxID=77065 RepID=A0A9Q0ZED2_SALPP|nr:hypothetical protein OIU79_002737 [Salix purpurea]